MSGLLPSIRNPESGVVFYFGLGVIRGLFLATIRYIFAGLLQNVYFGGKVEALLNDVYMSGIGNKRISRLAMVIVFLALIRIIGEFFRLDHSLRGQLTIDQFYPYMLGAMLCAVSCFVMTILTFYERHVWITAIAVLTIIGLLVLKYMLIV